MTSADAKEMTAAQWAMVQEIGRLLPEATVTLLFVRGLTVAHFDAVLKQNDEARRFLADDIQAELASRNVDAFVHAA